MGPSSLFPRTRTLLVFPSRHDLKAANERNDLSGWKEKKKIEAKVYCNLMTLKYLEGASYEYSMLYSTLFNLGRYDRSY